MERELFTAYHGEVIQTMKYCYVKAKNHTYNSRLGNGTYKVTEEFMGVPLFWHVVIEQLNEGKLNRSFLHYITLEGVEGYFEARYFEVVDVKESIVKRIINKLWKLRE